MSSDRSEYGFAALALAFVSGGLIGTALGLLFAPRSGVETRERVREQADEARERLRETAETVKARAEELAETGKEKFLEAQEKVQESVEKMRGKFSSQKENEPPSEI